MAGIRGLALSGVVAAIIAYAAGEVLEAKLRQPNDTTLKNAVSYHDLLEDIDIQDSSKVTAQGLLYLGSVPLHTVTIQRLRTGLISGQGGPGGWMQKLPNPLKTLVITGPTAPLWSQQPWVVQTADLLVLLHYVTDSHLAGLLPGLKDRLTGLAITHSAEVTTAGLSHMGNLHKLDVLRLSGPAARLLNVTMLGDPQKLEVLQLGLLDGPQEEGISAAAVIKLVVACKGLGWLYINTDETTTQDVLDGLVKTPLGKDTLGLDRTIYVEVPKGIYGKLNKPADGGPIEVDVWVPSGRK